MTYALYVSILLFVGMAGGKLANKVNLPSVTGYILCGFLLGPSVANFITSEVYHHLGFVNELALGMLAISVGTELHRLVFKQFGKRLVSLSLGNTIFTAVLVTLVTWAIGMQIQYALILGTLALTVSPAGVVTILKEKQAKGEMTENLLGLVAFDNLVCIIAFGIMVSLVQSAGNENVSELMLIGRVFLDILIAVILGCLSGGFISYLIRQDTRPDKLLTLLLGVLLFNTGIASLFGLSPILTNMMAGMAITNLTSRKVLIASLLERIELPIFVIFLTLAGAHINLSVVWEVGLIGIGYIIARMIGRVGGVFIASGFTQLSFKVRKNLGIGLLPQAGIAIGLATIAERSIPNISGAITGVVLTGAVFFEIFGPLLLGKAIDNVGEATATGKTTKTMH